MDLRNWIILFPVTFLFTSLIVLCLSPRFLQRWFRNAPAEAEVACVSAGFLSHLVFLALLIPLWWMVRQYHDHSVYFFNRRVVGHSFTLGLQVNAALAYYLSIVAVGVCGISGLQVRRAKNAASRHPSGNAAVLLLTIQVCFSLALLSADLLQMMVCAYLGFLTLTRHLTVSPVLRESRRELGTLRKLSLLFLLVVVACGFWLTALGNSSDPSDLQNHLPSVSTGVMKWILWISSVTLIFHAGSVMCFLPPRRSAMLVGFLSAAVVWWVVDACLFDRLLLSVLPPWVLAAIGL